MQIAKSKRSVFLVGIEGDSFGSFWIYYSVRVGDVAPGRVCGERRNLVCVSDVGYSVLLIFELCWIQALRLITGVDYSDFEWNGSLKNS